MLVLRILLVSMIEVDHVSDWPSCKEYYLSQCMFYIFANGNHIHMYT